MCYFEIYILGWLHQNNQRVYYLRSITFLMVRTPKIYSLSKFIEYNMLLLIIIITLCNRSLEIIFPFNGNFLPFI